MMGMKHEHDNSIFPLSVFLWFSFFFPLLSGFREGHVWVDWAAFFFLLFFGRILLLRAPIETSLLLRIFVFLCAFPYQAVDRECAVVSSFGVHTCCGAFRTRISCLYFPVTRSWFTDYRLREKIEISNFGILQQVRMGNGSGRVVSDVKTDWCCLHLSGCFSFPRGYLQKSAAITTFIRMVACDCSRSHWFLYLGTVCIQQFSTFYYWLKDSVYSIYIYFIRE